METKVTPGKSTVSSTNAGDKPLSKSAAKNAKRKAKKLAEKEKVIRANWEDDDDDDVPENTGTGRDPVMDKIGNPSNAAEATGTAETEQPSSATVSDGGLAEELQNLAVR